MKPLIAIEPDKCKICYACVRACPVKAITIKAPGQVPTVLINRCIGCGSCVSACSPRALTYRSAKQELLDIIKSGKEVVTMIDPAIASEFVDITDYRKFVQMVKQFGVKAAYEVSFGVDLVARRYNKLINNFNGKYYITSNCPCVVSYVEKFHPDLVQNLAPIVSPMIATARMLKQKLGENVAVAHIGPCIEAKNEAFRYADKPVDVVLTFQELRDMFDEHHISESNLEFSDYEEPLGYIGSLYPISRGIVQAAELDEALIKGTVITTEGKTNVIQALKEFEEDIIDINLHFNLFFCKGCLAGPGSTKGRDRVYRRAQVIKYTNKRIKDFDRAAWEAQLNEFNNLELAGSFTPNDQRLLTPTEERIQQILHAMGKTTPESHEDCGACGYATCHSFADAIAKGLTVPEMCTPYTFQNQLGNIKSLKATNEKLAIIQTALRESERQARSEHEAAKEAGEITATMLQKLPAGVVLVDNNLKIVNANHSFIKQLGVEAADINEVIPGLTGADLKTFIPVSLVNTFTYVLNTNEEVLNKDLQFNDQIFTISVFPIKKGKIVGAVFRDLLQPEVRKEEIISRISDVIDKNLEMVQQIGFLLGEGASETERMLNSIVQTYKSKKEEL